MCVKKERERERERERKRANCLVVFDSELEEMTLPMEFGRLRSGW
jgi:hypothetical protein